MNVEFHYYTLHFLATQAGFSNDEAYIIAYSSQYLDNALVPYQIQTERGRYTTLVTHHFGFWNSRQEDEVWIPFHFFPGDADFPGAERVDGGRNPYNVTPNSRAVKEYLIEALKSRNLYRVGIALHTYADSWAHQNFSGRNEDWNRIDDRSMIPPAGHAQALASPDNLEAVWEDPRLIGARRIVRNRDRFFQAAERIYRYLCTYNHRSFEDWELVEMQLAELLGGGPTGSSSQRVGSAFGAEPEKQKEERVLDFVIEKGIPEFKRNQWKSDAFHLDQTTGDENIGGTYDKLLWLRHEILHETRLLEQRTVRGKEGFYSSHLYRWNEAAVVQKASAKRILANLLG